MEVHHHKSSFLLFSFVRRSFCTCAPYALLVYYGTHFLAFTHSNTTQQGSLYGISATCVTGVKLKSWIQNQMLNATHLAHATIFMWRSIPMSPRPQESFITIIWIPLPSHAEWFHNFQSTVIHKYIFTLGPADLPPFREERSPPWQFSEGRGQLRPPISWLNMTFLTAHP